MRVGPFVAQDANDLPSQREAGLAAAAEWLHFGAVSVVLDLGKSFCMIFCHRPDLSKLVYIVDEHPRVYQGFALHM